MVLGMVLFFRNWTTSKSKVLKPFQGFLTHPGRLPHDLQFNPQMFVEISQLMQQAAMEQHGAAYILTQDSEMSAFGPHWSSVIKKVGRVLKNQPSHFLTGSKQTKNL